MSHTCGNTGNRQELPCINCDCESSARPASCAPSDSEMLDWMIQHCAWIGWTRDHEYCRVMKHSGDEDGAYPVCGWPRFFDDPKQAIAAAMAHNC